MTRINYTFMDPQKVTRGNLEELVRAAHQIGLDGYPIVGVTITKDKSLVVEIEYDETD